MKPKQFLGLSVAIPLCVLGCQTSFSQGEVFMASYGYGGGFVRFSNTVIQAWASEGVVAGLYWGENAGDVTKLAAPLAGITGPALTADSALWGYILLASGGGTRTIGRAGQPTYFQLRAWAAGFDSWESALASGEPSVLISKLSQAPIALAYPSITPDDIFAIPWGGTRENPIIVEMVPVPEPAAWVLSVLGGWLLFQRVRARHGCWSSNH